MKISSVIFDMDGVIIDSEPHWAKAQIHALADFDIHITIQTCEQLTRGKRIDEIASTWIQHFNLPTDTRQLADKILNHVYQAILREGQPMLGLYELLDFLKAKHIKTAVATSSSPKIIQAVFDKLKLWDYFTLQCSAEHEQFGKPHPAVYLKTIQKLGVEAKECLVIEDSVIGLIAAKAAGLRTFLVNPDYQNAKFAIADAQLPTLLDVIKKLEND